MIVTLIYLIMWPVHGTFSVGSPFAIRQLALTMISLWTEYQVYISINRVDMTDIMQTVKNGVVLGSWGSF